ERRQRLDRRREDQHQAEDAEKDGERHQPPLARLASPQAARKIRDRPAGGSQHDQPAPGAADSLDHATSSVTRADDAARLVTTKGPQTSASMPQRRNVR